MQRVFGAIAIFAGWLSIVIGAIWGLISSEFLGLAHKEGAVPPSAVYGFSAAVVLWVFTAVALVALVPLAAAMVAVDPRRQLRWSAQAMAIAGVVLLPDELGRAFGLPLLVGAACLWIGGELIHREALALTTAGSAAQAPGPAVETGGGAEGEARSDLLPAALPDSAAPVSAAPVSVAPVSVATAQAGSPAALPDSAVSPGSTSARTEKASGPAEGRGRRSPRRRSAGAKRICPWCSTAVPANAESCPNCNATLDETAADEMSIPGVTEVPSRLLRYADRARLPRASLLSMVLGGEPIPTARETPSPSDAAAIRPPSPELKEEMARLDAEIAAGKASLGAEGGGAALGEARGESAPPGGSPLPGGSSQSGESAQPAKGSEPSKALRRPTQRRRSGPRT